MTAVVARFRYQGTINVQQARSLSQSYTHLGVRKIELDEQQRVIALEYDATRMDRAGVASLLRRLGVPVTEAVT